MKVCFLYNAQLHQIPHSLPIALELAARQPDIEVEVAGASTRHLDFARRIAQRFSPDAPVTYRLLDRPWYWRCFVVFTGTLAPIKKRTLNFNRHYLAGFDALVTPERTALVLRRRGWVPPQTRMIHTGHGAGDRAVTVLASSREFDFVINSGIKLQQRRLDAGAIRPGDFVSGVYAKFDWALAPGWNREPLFDNGRPTVLYNPHFDPEASSWHTVGWKVLDYFAQSTRYNLVFAPHVRLFEPPSRSVYRQFRRYANLSHMHIDLGSERSIDMSYTLGADAYVGDVSSQVAEFVLRPRPCLFLDVRGTAWQDDPNYRFWQMGPVLHDIGGLDSALLCAFQSHADYETVQRQYFDDTFGGAGVGESSALRGADALAAFLRRPIIDSNVVGPAVGG